VKPLFNPPKPAVKKATNDDEDSDSSSISQLKDEAEFLALVKLTQRRRDSVNTYSEKKRKVSGERIRKYSELEDRKPMIHPNLFTL
jgi:hypothetical protein